MSKEQNPIRRRVLFKSVGQANQFLKDYERYISYPKYKIKEQDEFSVLDGGGLYRFLNTVPVEDGHTRYAQLEFYMNHDNFEAIVIPHSKRELIGASWNYICLPKPYSSKVCNKVDCVYRMEKGKCGLSVYEYNACNQFNYTLHYVKRLPNGLPAHHPPVHTASGCRFGW